MNEYKYSYTINLQDTRLETFLRRFQEYLTRIKSFLADFSCTWEVRGDPKDSVLIQILRGGREISRIDATHYRTNVLRLHYVWDDVSEDKQLMLVIIGVFLDQFYEDDNAFWAIANAESTKPDESSLARLTPREEEVIDLVVKGFGTAEIARRLVISAHTVKTHKKNIRDKTGMNTIAHGELAKIVQKMGDGHPPKSPPKSPPTGG